MNNFKVALFSHGCSSITNTYLYSYSCSFTPLIRRLLCVAGHEIMRRKGIWIQQIWQASDFNYGPLIFNIPVHCSRSRTNFLLQRLNRQDDIYVLSLKLQFHVHRRCLTQLSTHNYARPMSPFTSDHGRILRLLAHRVAVYKAGAAQR